MPKKTKKVANKLGGLSGRAAKALSSRRSRMDSLEASIVGPRKKKKKK